MRVRERTTSVIVARAAAQAGILPRRLTIGNFRARQREATPGSAPRQCVFRPERMGALSPQTLGGSGVSLNIYTKDCDAMFKRAVAAGATVNMPLPDVL